MFNNIEGFGKIIITEQDNLPKMEEALVHSREIPLYHVGEEEFNSVKKELEPKLGMKILAILNFIKYRKTDVKH